MGPRKASHAFLNCLKPYCRHWNVYTNSSYGLTFHTAPIQEFRRAQKIQDVQIIGVELPVPDPIFYVGKISIRGAGSLRLELLVQDSCKSSESRLLGLVSEIDSYTSLDYYSRQMKRVETVFREGKRSSIERRFCKGHL